jgi:hypothetical protein
MNQATREWRANLFAEAGIIEDKPIPMDNSKPVRNVKMWSLSKYEKVGAVGYYYVYTYPKTGKKRHMWFPVRSCPTSLPSPIIWHIVSITKEKREMRMPLYRLTLQEWPGHTKEKEAA